MDLRHPLSLASPGAHGKVLRVLLRAGEALTGREVSRRAALSQAGAARVLAVLVEDGLVQRFDHPPAALYRMNRDHLAYRPLADLDELVPRLVQRITAEVDGWSRKPMGVALFGSLARGEADRDSDIDVLVVRADTVLDVGPEWEAQLSALERAVQRWTGNPARVVEYGAQDLSQGIGSVLLATIRDEGVSVWGPGLRELIPLTAHDGGSS